MRTVFLFFLLLNAGYFYWQSDWFRDEPMPALLKEPSLPAGVERLTLLRERGLGGTAATSKSAAPPAEEAPASAAQRQAVQPEMAQTASPEPVPAAPEKSAELVCFTLGPFKQATLASQTAEAISALGITVERRQESQRTPRGYWVYLPSLKSYSEARDKVQEMKQLGLSDLFIMGKGEHQNAISLGLFKSQQAAEDRHTQVKGMGFDAVLAVQYREKKQGWLDMSVAGDQTTAVAALSEMAEEIPGVNLTQRKCE